MYLFGRVLHLASATEIRAASKVPCIGASQNKCLSSDSKTKTPDSKLDHNCIFCQISNTSTTKTKLLYSDDTFAAFADHKPVAKYHVLIVPKLHFGKLSSLNKHHVPMIRRMEEIGKQIMVNEQLVMETPIDSNDVLMGFHWPICTISHLHLHVIHPASSMSYLNRNVLYSTRFMFGTVDMAITLLNNKQ